MREPACVLDVVAARVRLADQDILLPTEPPTRPCLIRPSKAEREIGFPRGEHLVQWPCEQAAALEPVVPVAERLNAVRAGEFRLLLAHLRDAKVVVAEHGRSPWLLVPLEERPRLDDVRPLGEPWPPPCIVFVYRVELWQIERNDPCRHCRHRFSSAESG
jgi:hypothetical protein